jgi:hypothetical protein
MTANQPYDSMSLIRYQMSVLSLGAALDQQASIGKSEESEESLSALFEAEQLKDLVDRRHA